MRNAGYSPFAANHVERALGTSSTIRRTPKSGTAAFHHRISRLHDDMGLAAGGLRFIISLYPEMRMSR